MRPQSLLNLLNSVKAQTVYPNEIIIVDGSTDFKTKEILEINAFKNLKYFVVTPENRGLTKQRNFGIKTISASTEVVCFLDDDVILNTNYFDAILNTYTIFPEALGVGGFINNEAVWDKVAHDYKSKINEFYFDGWKRKDGIRFVLRKRLGLDSDKKPGYLPEFSNGRSVGFLPPSGKIYQVEQLKGGVSSFKRTVFDSFQFSPYFEGYGLYEDADFTLRVSKTGSIYINTNAQLAHYHDQAGRPNKFLYGKMVVRNGWYVWRVKYPNPSLIARVKWNLIVLLLTFALLHSIFTGSKRKESIHEFFGRIVGWLSLIINK